MLQNCGIDVHRRLYSLDKTINVLWSTVRPSLSLSSELEQKSAIGPHIAPILIWGISPGGLVSLRQGSESQLIV